MDVIFFFTILLLMDFQKKAQHDNLYEKQKKDPNPINQILYTKNNKKRNVRKREGIYIHLLFLNNLLI